MPTGWHEEYCNDKKVNHNDNSTPFPAIPTGFTLTFEDNFDDIGNQPGDDWTYDLGDGTNSPAGWGWGNSERQTYENDADTVHIIDLIARDSTEADTDGTNDGQMARSGSWQTRPVTR